MTSLLLHCDIRIKLFIGFIKSKLGCWDIFIFYSLSVIRPQKQQVQKRNPDISSDILQLRLGDPKVFKVREDVWSLHRALDLPLGTLLEHF